MGISRVATNGRISRISNAHRAVFELKAPKAVIKGVLAGHTVAMVTYYVMERTTTCSPIVGQCFDTMIVASSDKMWLQ